MNRRINTTILLIAVAAVGLAIAAARAADVSAPGSTGAPGGKSPSEASVGARPSAAKAAEVTGLALSPPAATVPIGGSIRFKALATLADGDMLDATAEADWAPGSSFTARQEGVFYVAAAYGGQKAVATVTVIGRKKTPQGAAAATGGRTVPEDKTAAPPPPAPAAKTDFGQQFGDRERQRREERSRREGVDSSGAFSGAGPGKGRTTPEDLRRQTEQDGAPWRTGPYGPNPTPGGGQSSRAPGPPPGTGGESLRYYIVQKTAAGTWRWPSYQCTLTTYEVLSADEKEFPALYTETRRRFDQDNQYCRDKGCDSGGPGAGSSRYWKPQKWSVSYQGPLNQYPQNLPTDQRSCTGEMR